MSDTQPTTDSTAPRLLPRGGSAVGTPTKTRPPRRAFHLTLTVQADTEAELLQVLDEYAELARTNVPRGSLNSAMGGVSSGACYEATVDPTMTHERYVRELDAYFDRERGRQ